MSNEYTGVEVDKWGDIQSGLPEGMTLKFVGYVDELDRSIHHTGWYCSPWCESGETFRGVVYKVPKEPVYDDDGYEQEQEQTYYAGYHEVEGGCFTVLDLTSSTDDEYTVVRWADSMAEREAEFAQDAYIKDDAEHHIDEARSLSEDLQDEIAVVQSIYPQTAETHAELDRLESEVEEQESEIRSWEDTPWKHYPY